jgi:hypothetical protein
MPRYTLKDDGYPTYKKIVTGRKWIGRVCKTTTGFLGIIGPTQFKAATEKAAFDGVVAKHCGYADVADMDDANRAIRASNSRARAAGRYVADQLIQGNFEPFGRMLDKLDKEG